MSPHTNPRYRARYLEIASELEPLNAKRNHGEQLTPREASDRAALIVELRSSIATARTNPDNDPPQRVR